MYKVKEVADLAGVSVRTLHHYDRMELLKPSEVLDNGYRLYSDADLAKLQQILFFKELDFPLQRIKEILDSPDFDQRAALRTHHELLQKKRQRLDRIMESVEQTLHAMEGEVEMTAKDRFEPFDMSEIEAHQKKYEQETKEKYGGTSAYEESTRRAASYTKDDWQRIKENGDAIYMRIAELMDRGPEDAEVQAEIGKWRQHITDNFYDCSLEILRGLGDMYVADERFTKNIDKYRTGLAAFLQQAMHVYCDHHEQGN